MTKFASTRAISNKLSSIEKVERLISEKETAVWRNSAKLKNGIQSKLMLLCHFLPGMDWVSLNKQELNVVCIGLEQSKLQCIITGQEARHDVY